MKREVFFLIDVETDGPIPGDCSMISLGVVTVDGPERTFYRELRPIAAGNPETIAWLKREAGLDWDKLHQEGADPNTAMQEFVSWLNEVCGADGRPVFVAFNATFDWMFTHWYLVHFLGRDPFGISGLDIKAYYMGVAGKQRWTDTAKGNIPRRFKPNPNELPHTHNALDDARQQAEMFRRIRTYATGETGR